MISRLYGLAALLFFLVAYYHEHRSICHIRFDSPGLTSFSFILSIPKHVHKHVHSTQRQKWHLLGIGDMFQKSKLKENHHVKVRKKKKSRKFSKVEDFFKVKKRKTEIVITPKIIICDPWMSPQIDSPGRGASFIFWVPQRWFTHLGVIHWLRTRDLSIFRATTFGTLKGTLFAISPPIGGQSTRFLAGSSPLEQGKTTHNFVFF